MRQDEGRRARLGSGSQTTKPEIPVAEELPASKTIVIVFEGGKVNVCGGNGLAYGCITQHEPGTTCLYVATAENGWHAVVVGKRVGWVSGACSRICRPTTKGSFAELRRSLMDRDCLPETGENQRTRKC